MGYIYFNPNPQKAHVGDCTIRAISRATGKDWERVYGALSTMGFALADMPSSNHVWGAYLRKEGFKRYIVDDGGNDLYTVRDFCRDHPKGTYILAIDGHVVCVSDGNYYDSWDSGDEIPLYYWKKGE